MTTWVLKQPASGRWVRLVGDAATYVETTTEATTWTSLDEAMAISHRLKPTAGVLIPLPAPHS